MILIPSGAGGCVGGLGGVKEAGGIGGLTGGTGGIAGRGDVGETPIEFGVGLGRNGGTGRIPLSAGRDVCGC